MARADGVPARRLYSYDWLDQVFGYLDRPSASRLLPEYQRLEVGDLIPIVRGFGFPVRASEQHRMLLLAGEAEDTKWLGNFGSIRSTAVGRA